MSGALPSSRDRNAELLALVADLEVIQHRILDLTNGKIDAVVHPSGILSLLPAAQESLRRREAEQRAFATERAAILDAIPAQIALLNETGQILVVNKRWLAFGCANAGADGNANHSMPPDGASRCSSRREPERQNRTRYVRS